MERAFQISAAVLIGAAAVFFLADNFDGVFIAVVLACLSFFLSVRTQVKRRLNAREQELLASQEEGDAEDGRGDGITDTVSGSGPAEPAEQEN
jgi:MFS superfamily sulfate permease-like transporter